MVRVRVRVQCEGCSACMTFDYWEVSPFEAVTCHMMLDSGI